MHPSLMTRASSVCLPLLVAALVSLQCGDMEGLDLEGNEIGDEVKALTEFSYFSAHTREGGILVSWGTRQETDCAGFHIQRRISGSGAYARINSKIIPALDPAGAQYSYDDRPLGVGTYDYKLEIMNTKGASTLSSLVTVSVFGDGGDDSGLNCALADGQGSQGGGLGLIMLALALLWRRARRGPADAS